MFPEIILYGTFKYELQFIIEYDEHLALAGLPPYYIHRGRYKGDKLKHQRTVSELPIPEPNVVLGGERSIDGGDFSADMTIVNSFEECLPFLPLINMALTFDGNVGGQFFHLFIAERKRIDADARIQHEKEKRLARADTEGFQPELFD